MKSKAVLLRSGSVNPDPPVEKVACELVKSGFEVTVLSWDRDNQYSSAESEIAFPCGKAKIVRFGIPAVYSGGFKKNIVPLIKFEKKLLKWLENNKTKYDIIHAFDMDTGIVAAIAAKKHKTKLVYHILDFYADSHCSENSFLRKIVKNTEFSVINAADAVIICTEKRLCQIKGSKPKLIGVIHNTPDGNILTGRAANDFSNSERIKIAYAGILTANRLICELVQCVMSDDRFELYIAGFGELEGYIKDCGSKCDRIIYRGKLPYDEVLAMECSCDIMTAMYSPNVVNHRYAAPNKLYEAMMLGKPVIMCKNTGWDEVITQNNIGILADASKEGVRDALNMIYSERDQWHIMSENGKRLYQNMYSWEIMKKRLIDIYNSVCSEGE